MTSTSDSRFAVLMRKPLVRILAAFAVVIGPAAAAPILLSGGAAHADQSPIGCYNGRDVLSPSIDGPAGTATVELNDGTHGVPTNGNPQLCNTVALVAYYFKYDARANTTDRYPQVEAAAKVYEVTSTDPTTISLPTDKCYAQLDVIYGIAQDGSSTIIKELDQAEYAQEGILLNHEDFTPPDDCTTPPTSPTTPVSTPTTCSSTTTVTVTPTTTGSVSPTKSTSPTPPDCTVTTTPTPPVSTPTTCSSTTTVTVTPTTTGSVSPTKSTSPTPPDCTVTTTPTPPVSTPTTCSSTTTVTVTPTTTGSVSPTTSTSPTPPDCTTTVTSTPPVTSTSVLASSTSKAPPSSTSPSFSTSVLPFSTSQAPTSTPPGTLPFTGANAPVKGGVLAALGLISVGGALVLFAGRRRKSGGHRVG